MLEEPIKDQLNTLRLGAMLAAWEEQRKCTKTQQLSFDERFALIVEAEHLARDNRRLSRLLREAKLRHPEACVEDVDASPQSSALEGGRFVISQRRSPGADHPRHGRRGFSAGVCPPLLWDDVVVRSVSWFECAADGDSPRGQLEHHCVELASLQSAVSRRKRMGKRGRQARNRKTILRPVLSI